jgi:hypothetical protein
MAQKRFGEGIPQIIIWGIQVIYRGNFQCYIINKGLCFSEEGTVLKTVNKTKETYITKRRGMM